MSGTSDWVARFAQGERDPEVMEAFRRFADSVIDRLLGQVSAHLRDGHGVVILEIGFDQAEPLRALVAERLPGTDLTFRRDLAGIERVAVIHV